MLHDKPILFKAGKCLVKYQLTAWHNSRLFVQSIGDGHGKKGPARELENLR